jgi:DNA-binding transcriptional LysR family regulator
VLATLREAQDQVDGFRGLQSGPLDVGLASTAEYFVPHLIARFHAEHPGVEIRLQVANNREQLITLMQRGEIELAIMGRPPQGWPTRAEPFAMHPHVLVTPADHPFNGIDIVAATALSREGFIVREPGSGTRAALDEYMRAHQMTPRVVMQMSSNEAIKQAVIAGMGVSLLSLHTVALELQHGLLATPTIEGLPVMRRWHVVNKLAKTLSPAAEAFRYFILERAEAYLASQFSPSPGR